MPAITTSPTQRHHLTRRAAAAVGTTHIAAIAIVIAVLLVAGMYWLFRRRRARQLAAQRANKSRAYANAVFPRQVTVDPELPPYEARDSRSSRRWSRTEGQRRSGDASQSQRGSRGERASAGGGGGAREGGETGGEGEGVDLQAVLRAPPPARVHTPPGYGQHIADREAGPLSEQPPAYDEEGRLRWGRSGVFR
jgi:uncharacterized membrane protein YgcG